MAKKEYGGAIRATGDDSIESAKRKLDILLNDINET